MNYFVSMHVCVCVCGFEYIDVRDFKTHLSIFDLFIITKHKIHTIHSM